MTIGEYIHQKRISAGLSAEELGTKIGKNRATIYRYENNSIGSLPSDVLIPLANALSISPMDLIQLNQTVPPKASSGIQLGQRIKESRLSQKMTLKTLGHIIGLSESTTKRYEDGQIKSVSIDVIKRFAVALEVAPAYLLGWEPESLSNDESQLIKKYRRLDDVGKDTVNAVFDVQLKRLDE